MIVKATVIISKGIVRNKNEDDFYINGLYLKKNDMDAGCVYKSESCQCMQLFAVCDGMGGENEGKEASFCAVSFMDDLCEDLIQTGKIQESFDQYTTKVNEEILKYHYCGHMGTTLACVCAYGDSCYIAHLGDSRVYFIHKGQMLYVTEDHTEGNRLLKEGKISEQDLLNYPTRKALTRYLGMNYTRMKVQADIIEIKNIEKGDRFILCTDGATDVLTDENLLILVENVDSDIASKRIVQAAMALKSTDNITAMVLDIL